MNYTPLAPRHRPDGHIPAWLFIGQSNVVGTSTATANHSHARNDPQLYRWSRAGSDPLPSAESIAVESLADSTSKKNAEFGFLRTMAFRGRHVVAVKNAENGKGLHNYFLPGQSGWDKLLESIPAAEAAFGTPVFWQGLYWCQGMNDSNVPEVGTGPSQNYQANLTTFVSELRKAVGNPRMYFVAPEHPPTWVDAAYTGAADVRAAVSSFAAADPYGVSFGANDTATRDTGVHYTEDSYELIGVRAANLVIDTFDI